LAQAYGPPVFLTCSFSATMALEASCLALCLALLLTLGSAASGQDGGVEHSGAEAPVSSCSLLQDRAQRSRVDSTKTSQAAPALSLFAPERGEEVPCTDITDREAARFHAVHGPNARIETCYKSEEGGGITVEVPTTEMTHAWVLGRSGKSCDEVCGSAGGCVKDASIWPATEEAAGFVFEHLLYPCEQVVASSAPGVPSVRQGVCAWQRQVPHDVCGSTPLGLRVCACRTRPVPPESGNVERILWHFDLDGSGGLEIWEVAQFAVSRKQAYAVMSLLDSDGSGAVSAEELRAVMDRAEEAAQRESEAELGLTQTNASLQFPVTIAAGFAFAKALMVAFAIYLPAEHVANTVQTHARAWQKVTSHSMWKGWNSTKQAWYAPYDKLTPTSRDAQPTIDEIYTHGGAGPVHPPPGPPRGPHVSSGCWPGLRVVTERFYGAGLSLIGAVRRDLVAAVAAVAGYNHVPMSMVYLNVNEPVYSTFHSCGDGKGQHWRPSVSEASGALLHLGDRYTAGIEGLTKYVNKEDDSHCPSSGFRKPPDCVTPCYTGTFKSYCYTSSRRGWWAPQQTCEKCSPCRHGWEAAAGCVSRFSYKGKSHWWCTEEDTPADGRFGWCSLDDQYQGNWRLCKSGCSSRRQTENPHARHLETLSIFVAHSYKNMSERGDVSSMQRVAEQRGYDVRDGLPQSESAVLDAVEEQGD